MVITCPSRFKARKGQLELLRAMSALGSLTSHVVLVLAGSINSADKNYLDQIRRAATRIGLGERLHILEDVPRARMPDLLAASDIVAQPSYFEGLGLAALEAMAAGACTILTDTHGFNEIGSHLHTTFYVQPCSTDSLAAGLRVLLENPALRSRLAGEARRATPTPERRESAWATFASTSPSAPWLSGWPSFTRTPRPTTTLVPIA